MKLTVRLLVVIAALFVTAPHTQVSASDDDVAQPWIATYHGSTIDLREGWSTAHACTSDGITTTCFDTEAEMDLFLGSASLVTGLVDKVVSMFSTCSSNLKLYVGLSYTGNMVNLNAQGTYLNLSGWGIDNDTTSYKVGTCGATFYDGAGGGAPVYPGNTAAGAQSASMATGWNDRISSVYIF